MAFKFKVKKRPSMGQAVAASFASGLGQGIQAGGQAALQQMIRDREANKKLTQERATVAKGYGNTILQMANNVEEQELQKKLKTIAYKLNMNLYSDPQLGVNEVVELGVLDDSTLKPYAEELDITLPEERYPKKEFELGDTKDVTGNDDVITMTYTMNTETGKPEWVETSRATRYKKDKVKEPAKYKAWNIGTGKEVRATEEEVENSNGNIIFGGQPTAPKDPTTKAVFNTKTGKLQWATEKQISTSAGALTPVQNWDMLLDIPEENTGDISTAQENVAEKKQALDNQSVLNDTTFAAVAAGTATIQVGDIISDPDLGQMKFNGGDPTDWSNYDLLDLE